MDGNDVVSATNLTRYGPDLRKPREACSEANGVRDERQLAGDLGGTYGPLVAWKFSFYMV